MDDLGCIYLVCSILVSVDYSPRPVCFTFVDKVKRIIHQKATTLFGMCDYLVLPTKIHLVKIGGSFSPQMINKSKEYINKLNRSKTRLDIEIISQYLFISTCGE